MKHREENIWIRMSESGTLAIVRSAIPNLFEATWGPASLVLIVWNTSRLPMSDRLSAIALGVILTLIWGYRIQPRKIPLRLELWGRELSLATLMREDGYDLASIVSTICWIRRIPYAFSVAGLGGRAGGVATRITDVKLSDPLGPILVTPIRERVTKEWCSEHTWLLQELFCHAPIQIWNLVDGPPLLFMRFIIHQPISNNAPLGQSSRALNIFASAPSTSMAVSSGIRGPKMIWHRIRKFEKSCRHYWFCARVLFAVALKTRAFQ
jgi:hypothetical protein